jgi:hypothetical protein
MAIETFYESHVDLGGSEFPILYQIYKDGDLELGRTMPDFSTLPPGVGAAYIKTLKDHMINLIALIPEKDAISPSERANMVKLVYAASHLSSCIPVTEPIAQPEANE